MGELGLNKILGALLATALGLFGLKTLSDVVFAHGGEGHGEEHAEATSLSEQMCEKFAYCVEIAGGGGAAAEEEEVFDLGALLAAADVSRGERTFKGQCTTCHTIDEAAPTAPARTFMRCRRCQAPSCGLQLFRRHDGSRRHMDL